MENTIITGVTGPISPDEENTQPITDSMQPTEKPLLLGKFKSSEDLAKAYSELEKKLGAKTEEEPEEDEEEETQDGEDASEDVEIAGIKLSSLSQEYEENGSLSEDSYDALQKAGIPRPLVDAYIEGHKARLSQTTAYTEGVVGELKALAGGDDEYAAVTKWAGESMSEEEIDAFNMAISSGNKHLATMAVRGLVESYNREYGSTPTLVGGSDGIFDSVEKFNSVDEMVKAMSDPRYATDAYFRKQVEAKVVRSRLMRRAN